MLACFGSPLVDVVAHVDQKFLITHNLEADSAYVAADKGSVFQDLEDLQTERVCGGSVTNTVKVLKWLHPKAHVVYFGAIGDDDDGRFIQSNLTNVERQFQIVRTNRTGRCAVLINGITRTLCTQLGASTALNLAHLKDPTALKKLLLSKYIYFSAFLLRVSKECVKFLVDLCGKERQLLFNLGAPFLCDLYPEQMLNIIGRASVVFGNELELRALARILAVAEEADIKEICSEVYRVACEREQVLVITRGEKTALLLMDHSMWEVPAAKVDHVVDTNGAGDAFVGGFLSKFIRGCVVEECMGCGMSAAGEIIQNVGCSYRSGVS